MTDETSKKKEIGPLCKLAVQWCKDPLFWEWCYKQYGTMRTLEGKYVEEEHGKFWICHVCQVKSRRELDTNSQAKKLFEHHIRKPYMEWLEARK